MFSISAIGQELSPERLVDWSNAGVKTTYTPTKTIQLSSLGINTNGTVANDAIMTQAISSLGKEGGVIEFPQGTFLFNKSIRLPSGVILRGQGSSKTILKMSLGGTFSSIRAIGYKQENISTNFTAAGVKDENTIKVADTSIFKVGDWIRIIQNDTDLVNNSWSEKCVGQIVEIIAISGNTLTLDSELRLDYDLSRSPSIYKINPVENVGVESLKILRMDETTDQESNIYFRYVVNSRVYNIESENTTFSHVDISSSSNITVSESYFHHAFNYGGGGRGYGVVLQFTSNECLVENNVFNTLRHSMLLQAGSNGNVFAYNNSSDPRQVEWYGTFDTPSEITLHGNYPYANLFEGNEVGNIGIDNSHGSNGPYNTFYKNTASKYGMTVSSSSPNQNILVNEFSRDRIYGTHLEYGNSVDGQLSNEEQTNFTDHSLYYEQKPAFVTETQWGVAESGNGGTFPIKIVSFDTANRGNQINIDWVTSEEINNDYFIIERSLDGQTYDSVGEVDGSLNSQELVAYSFDDYVGDHCGDIFYRLRQVDLDGSFTFSDISTVEVECTDDSYVFPNPVSDVLNIVGVYEEVLVYDAMNNLVLQADKSSRGQLDMSQLTAGVYLVSLRHSDGTITTEKIIKNN